MEARGLTIISHLTLCMLGKVSADGILKYFSYCYKKIGFDTSCETVCMMCQILFSRKNKKIPSVCHLLNLPMAWKVLIRSQSLRACTCFR